MLASSSMIPFRRLTDPLQMPVGPTAQRFDVPAGFIPKDANAFWIVNANLFWVRLKGGTGTYTPIADGEGWLFKPGYSDAFTTQFPLWMSTIAVPRQGIAAGTGILEIAYGMGG